ncbi:MAG TPA: hypothetical protein VEH81_13490 [Ktedonobacteraceae bacterium]|nr:hypothetical protein [Ktedonobacteraceae bacterium]
MNEYCRKTTNFLGASGVLGGWVCLDGRPWGGGRGPCIVKTAFEGTPQRATIKAQLPSTQPPSPLRIWRTAVPFIIILLFAFPLFLFPLPALARTATNTGRIYGQLLDGTKRNAPVAGQSVTLQMAQGENASDLTSVKTDAHGMVSFSSLSTDKTINYALYTLYQGSQYYTSLIDLSSQPVQHMNLTVYDATTSVANIAIVQANILIDKADTQSNLITVSENYIFENLGLTTYVGSLQAHGSKPNALLFSLPKNARNVSLKSGFDGYQVIQVDTGFATNAAVPPGLSQFAFSFQIPYTTSQYDFSYTVVYPTVNLSMLIPLNIHASSAALDSQGPVNANQHTFQQFNAKKLLPNTQFHVQLDGLPVSQQAANPQMPNQNKLWIILAILLMLAIVGVTWLVYQFARRQTPPVRSSSNNALPSQNDQQEALLQELLRLDKAYEAGTIKKSEYDKQRTVTKAELRSLMRKDGFERSVTVKKTTRSSGKGAT